MMDEQSFDERVSGLDTSLFAAIKSQTTEADRRSLLAVQACVREKRQGYVYLEIGSYLGGSIQTHLLDQRCKKIYSVDRRQTISRDERVEAPAYPGNTETQMLSSLAALAPTEVSKVECFDGDASSVRPSSIQHPPDLCFIDGEHTPSAVIRDFAFCSTVCAADATILFHDAQTVFRGLRSVVRSLKRAGKGFSAHALSDMIYVICFQGSATPQRLSQFPSQAREDDLWSLRNDLRLMKWRAQAFGERASRMARRTA